MLLQKGNKHTSYCPEAVSRNDPSPSFFGVLPIQRLVHSFEKYNSVLRSVNQSHRTLEQAKSVRLGVRSSASRTRLIPRVVVIAATSYSGRLNSNLSPMRHHSIPALTRHSFTLNVHSILNVRRIRARWSDHCDFDKNSKLKVGANGEWVHACMARPPLSFFFDFFDIIFLAFSFARAFLASSLPTCFSRWGTGAGGQAMPV